MLLEAAWPPVMDTLADEAHELSDRLGDDHDLAVLLHWAQEHADAAPIRADVATRRLRCSTTPSSTGRASTPTGPACSSSGSSAGGRPQPAQRAQRPLTTSSAELA